MEACNVYQWPVTPYQGLFPVPLPPIELIIVDQNLVSPPQTLLPLIKKILPMGLELLQEGSSDLLRHENEEFGTPICFPSNVYVSFYRNE